MEIKKDILVPLGYGKYIRSDRIVAIEPITENRGPQRRTLVFIEGISEPLIASRSEAAIVRDLALSTEEVHVNEAVELLEQIYDSFRNIGPMIRKSIFTETGLNIDRIEIRIKRLIERSTSEGVDEPSLFDPAE